MTALFIVKTETAGPVTTGIIKTHYAECHEGIPDIGALVGIQLPLAFVVAVNCRIFGVSVHKVRGMTRDLARSAKFAQEQRPPAPRTSLCESIRPKVNRAFVFS